MSGWNLQTETYLIEEEIKKEVSFSFDSQLNKAFKANASRFRKSFSFQLKNYFLEINKRK